MNETTLKERFKVFAQDKVWSFGGSSTQIGESMPNIEIKAHYELEKVRGIARHIGAKHLGLDHQVDTYFFTKQARLKFRESSMSGAMLIPYLRSDSTDPKKSSYTLLDVKGLGRFLDFEAVHQDETPGSPKVVNT